MWLLTLIFSMKATKSNLNLQIKTKFNQIWFQNQAGTGALVQWVAIRMKNKDLITPQMINQWSIHQKRNSQKLKKKRAGVKESAALILAVEAAEVVNLLQVAQVSQSNLRKMKKFFHNQLAGANLLQARYLETKTQMKLWINQHRFPEVVNYLQRVKLIQWINKHPEVVEEGEADRQEAVFKIWILCNNHHQALNSLQEAEDEEIKSANKHHQLCQLQHLWKGVGDLQK